MNIAMSAKNEAIAAIYPKGIHGAIGEGLRTPALS